MGVIRTFVSYSTLDRERVDAVLRRVAPYGVRPWIDYKDLQGKAGNSLSEMFAFAIDDTSSLSLFLSRAAITSGWIVDEVERALPQVPRGRRIIPITLDPLDELELPPSFEAALRKRGDRIDTLHLDPTRAGFVEDYAAAVLDAGGVTSAEEVLLYLGHRVPDWKAKLPGRWQDLPAVDLRLSYPDVEDAFSPTESEWREIEAGFKFLRRHLGGMHTLRIAGQAPLGVGVIAGRTWNRGTNRVLEGWNGNERDGVGWTSAAAMAVADWTPEGSTSLPVSVEGSLTDGATRLTVAFLRADRIESQKAATLAWHASRSPTPRPLVIVGYPPAIGSAGDATALLNEALGMFAWLKATCPSVTEIDLVCGMPLALDAFLAHHLTQCGATIHFHDQVKPPAVPAYRLAISWS